MSALKFLNKKSWHTATIKNNEKVWQAEQRAAEEARKIAELEKQLEHERHVEQLQRLEAEAGRGAGAASEHGTRKRTQLEWMYEVKRSSDDGLDGLNAPGGQKLTKEELEEIEALKREEYLLGKRAVDLEAKRKEKIGGSGSNAFAVAASGFCVVDSDTKMREDPMTMVQMEEKRRLAAFKARNLAQPIIANGPVSEPANKHPTRADAQPLSNADNIKEFRRSNHESGRKRLRDGGMESEHKHKKSRRHHRRRHDDSDSSASLHSGSDGGSCSSSRYDSESSYSSHRSNDRRKHSGKWSRSSKKRSNYSSDSSSSLSVDRRNKKRSSKRDECKAKRSHQSEGSRREKHDRKRRAYDSGNKSHRRK